MIFISFIRLRFFYDSIFATNSHEDAIDIYLIPAESYDNLGLAPSAPSTAFLVAGTWSTGEELITTSVLSHEMGHCLGLWHTHHGPNDISSDTSTTCLELVDGSNCLECGDYVCDTPADPNMNFENGVDENCNYIGGEIEEGTGSLYNPDPTNIMSYTRISCYNHFTGGQGDKVSATIENHPILANILSDQTVLANRHNGNPTSNLGGYLSIYNVQTLMNDFEHYSSGSEPVNVILGEWYAFLTESPELQGERHLNWGIEGNDYLLEIATLMEPVYIESGINAWFEAQQEITIASEDVLTSAALNVNLNYHDPWYAYQENGNWIQPDAFRPLSEQGDGNGNVQVFLNQGNINDPNDPTPIYRLKAPRLYATAYGIYEFLSWSGVSGEIDFGGGATATSELETDVVFKQTGVTVTAHFVNAMTGNGRPINIATGETLEIPAGGTYLWEPSANNFQFNVNGTLNIIGTDNNRITLKPQESGSSLIGGIYISNGGILNCEYVDFEEFNYNLSLPFAVVVDDGEANISNCRFKNVENNGVFISTSGSGNFINNEIVGKRLGRSIGIETEVNGSGNDVSIHNNTIVDFDIGVKTTTTGSGFDMRNNILYFNNTENDGDICFQYNISDWLDVSIDYNNSYGFRDDGLGFPNAYTQHWEMDQDPLFANSSNGDFSLTANSPIIDEGDRDLDDDSSYWPNDVDDSDPDGTRLDMGAYYYDAIPGSPTNFTITGNVGQHPQLSWTLPSDLDLHAVEIFRRLTNQGLNYILLASISGTSTDYTDNEIYISSGGKFTPNACYKVRAVDHIDQPSNYTGVQCKPFNAGREISSIHSVVPDEYALFETYPNPFNPRTTIMFNIPEQTIIRINIYNAHGQLVNKLVNGQVSPGYKSIEWDGKNSSGQPVSSGVYIYTISAKSLESEKLFSDRKKMILLK